MELIFMYGAVIKVHFFQNGYTIVPSPNVKNAILSSFNNFVLLLKINCNICEFISEVFPISLLSIHIFMSQHTVDYYDFIVCLKSSTISPPILFFFYKYLSYSKLFAFH